MQPPLPPPVSSSLPLPPPPTFESPAGGAVNATANGGPVGDELYREAQEEITALRTELYGTRRKEWEAREALRQARADADATQAVVPGLQAQVEELREIAARVGPLQEASQALSRGKAEVDAEVEALRQNLAAVQAELTSEQAARRRAEEGRAKADSDRSRLQRQRDEAHAQLRLATKRAEEAEEEQCRAEEETAQCRAELQALRDAASPGEGFSDGGASEMAAAAEVDQLRAELDSERSHVASLMAALAKAKTQLTAQAEEATEAAEGASEQAEALKGREAELHQRETELYQRGLELARREAAIAAQAELVSEQQAAAAEVVSGAQQPTPPQPPPQLVEHEQPAAAPPSAPTEDSAAKAKIEALETTVRRLKIVREKLLHEMDEQSSIAEALSSENHALAEGLSEQRLLSAKWELQAQEGLMKAEQLKNMLSESAAWQAQDGEAAAATPEARVRELEGKLLGEQAKVAELDLQVRTLTAELTKACQHTGDLGRSILPVLTGIESRMEQMAAQQ